MLTIALLIFLILLGLVILFLVRGLQYVERHPELLTNASPRAYQLCQETFSEVVTRYHEVKQDALDRVIMAWHAPNGRYYMVTDEGFEERRSADDFTGAYRLRWGQIGGVGLRMQPGFKFVDRTGDRSADVQYTTGYAFRLLVVPTSGDTLDINVPVDNRDEAVEFVAHTVALAEQKGKRVNAVGFDRPPAPHRQRLRRY